MKIIYQFKNRINGKCYIGQTKDLDKRIKNHKYRASISYNLPFYTAINKYGWENFEITTLEEVEDNVADEKEVFWIKQRNSIIPNGYNVQKGGSKFKNDNPMFHEEIRKKLSEAFKGDKNPAKREEVKRKISMSARGRKISDETRKKMSENNGRYWLGKKVPQSAIDGHVKALKGRHGKQVHNSIPVDAIDISTGKVVKSFESQNDAAKWVKKNGKYINPSSSNITEVLKGRQKTAFGYYWKKSKCND